MQVVGQAYCAETMLRSVTLFDSLLLNHADMMWIVGSETHCLFEQQAQKSDKGKATT